MRGKRVLERGKQADGPWDDGRSAAHVANELVIIIRGGLLEGKGGNVMNVREISHEGPWEQDREVERIEEPSQNILQLEKA
mmetsp:Transcript_58892/g.175219  ORF Transcript_58892/g.175219 Transcript_58892/m.175219 type:complete len:81 (+) Transcript_58892:148-390(+)